MIRVGQSITMFDAIGIEYAGIIVRINSAHDPRQRAIKARIFSYHSIENDTLVELSAFDGEKNKDGFTWRYA